MEPFKIHILGCGSALPTLKHNASSQLIEMRGKCFMVDCGEGAQMQFRRSHIHFSKLNAIFISHMHGDHCFGLMGLLSTLGMLGRTSKLRIYAPKDYESLFRQQVEFFMQTMEYEMEMIPVDTEKQQVIYEDHSLTVETVPLQHRVPCCGFIFREKPTLPHIRRDMIDYYGIPVSQINNIKNGADWTNEDGDIIPNARLVQPADSPRSYAYCSDTRFVPGLKEKVKGVTVLYHESTYTSDQEDRAKIYYHSTARQAATIAAGAGVGTLLLGHYSARYNDEQVLLEEAKAVFDHSILSQEGMVFDVV
ncbi:ribonuclease Z [Segatella copri]|uniref:ribonuclease Z n=1 Tax=Segatella copri TaxID=165179 RepID=UPI001C4853B2|nr:ribonuclease Z [Segatella copri]MBW0047810.1 ribonuclease Z [Segatella copri]